MNENISLHCTNKSIIHDLFYIIPKKAIAFQEQFIIQEFVYGFGRIGFSIKNIYKECFIYKECLNIYFLLCFAKFT